MSVENVYIKLKDGEATVVGRSSDAICALVDMLASVLCTHAKENQMSPDELHAKVSAQLYKQRELLAQLMRKDAANIDVRDVKSEEERTQAIAEEEKREETV